MALCVRLREGVSGVLPTIRCASGPLQLQLIAVQLWRATTIRKAHTSLAPSYKFVHSLRNSRFGAADQERAAWHFGTDCHRRTATAAHEGEREREKYQLCLCRRLVCALPLFAPLYVLGLLGCRPSCWAKMRKFSRKIKALLGHESGSCAENSKAPQLCRAKVVSSPTRHHNRYPHHHKLPPLSTLVCP